MRSRGVLSLLGPSSQSFRIGPYGHILRDDLLTAFSSTRVWVPGFEAITSRNLCASWNRGCQESRRQSMNSPAGEATRGLSLPSVSYFKGSSVSELLRATSRLAARIHGTLVQPRPPIQRTPGPQLLSELALDADPSDLPAFASAAEDLRRPWEPGDEP
jgi:hypothetical protein